MAHVVAGAGRSAAALHEAAHTLARQELVGDIAKVWVNDKGGGKTEHPRIDLRTLSEQQLADLVIIICAGIHAERELVAKHILTEQVIALDHQQAQRVQVCGGFTDQKMGELSETARKWVINNEKKIRAVAKELNLRGRLRGDQVNNIAASAK